MHDGWTVSDKIQHAGKVCLCVWGVQEGGGGGSALRLVIYSRGRKYGALNPVDQLEWALQMLSPLRVRDNSVCAFSLELPCVKCPSKNQKIKIKNPPK